MGWGAAKQKIMCSQNIGSVVVFIATFSLNTTYENLKQSAGYIMEVTFDERKGRHTKLNYKKMTWRDLDVPMGAQTYE